SLYFNNFVQLILAMKLKKGISLVLAFFLLASNMGFAFNVHFCKGRLASVSAGYKVEEICKAPEKAAKKKCCASKAASHKKCCSDKKVDLKKNTDDLAIKTFSFHTDMPCILASWVPAIFKTYCFSPKQDTSAYCCDANAPPLFKLYSQYIFYS
ncbi:MAG TPA: hypothetical protein VFR70_08360, partial [Flavobacterium sp.]|nr:hypothetical protein [Flavobacterium sp.]